MKKRGYRVRIEDGRVIVEHRASFRRITLLFLVVGYLGYCLLPKVRGVLVSFYYSRDPVVGGFALLFLSIPLLSGLTWLLFASGEVMRCDRNELHFARRRTWGRWHRFRFRSSEVKKLRRAIRGSSKSRSYSVLTFDVQGRTYDMLEELSYTDSDRVLRACQAMGLDVVIGDVGDAMLKDIEKRGWWINPFRTDDLGGPSGSSSK